MPSMARHFGTSPVHGGVPLGQTNVRIADRPKVGNTNRVQSGACATRPTFLLTPGAQTRSRRHGVVSFRFPYCEENLTCHPELVRGKIHECRVENRSTRALC